MKSAPDRYFYVDIDIPPVAHVATLYLQEIFGVENVGDYRLTRDMEVIDIEALAREYKAVVLCPWQIPRIRGSFDLFVNFFSFQEMEPEVVANYAAFVAAWQTRFILLCNQETGKWRGAPGETGVLEPTTRDHYLRFFEQYDCLGIDSEIFGSVKDGFASEVMVLHRR